MRNLRSFFVLVFALLITKFEGFFPGSRSFRNKNPGNLKNWDPDLPKDPQGFDIFPSLRKGFSALARQVDLNFSRNLSIREFIQGKPGVYPGYSRTNQEAYIRFLAKNSGLGIADVPIIVLIDRIQQSIA